MSQPTSKTYNGNGHSAVIADPNNITRDECLALARCGKEAWNAWRQEFQVWKISNNRADFSYRDFREGPIDFSGFDFGDFANFEGATFGDGADFEGATFGNLASFEGATFGHLACFEGATFGNGAYFIGATFGNVTGFKGATFGDWARIEGVSFGNGAYFIDATFGREAHFQGTTFGDRANFDEAVFKGGVDFSARTWGELDLEEVLAARKVLLESHGLSPLQFRSISFRGAIFEDVANFSGREFTGPTDFAKAKFAAAPKFHNRKLHQDTSFDEAEFPPPSGSAEAARAYRTLKLAFAGQQATREEQRFFRLEMTEEARFPSPPKGRPAGLGETHWATRWLYRAYAGLADYGFSLARPFGYWLLGIALGFVAYVGLAVYAGKLVLVLPGQGGEPLSRWLEFAALQSLPLPGTDRWADGLKVQLFGENYANIWLSLVIVLQRIWSLLMLFLAGLALRNLFKMK